MIDCVTLWVGQRLGVIERACMRSVLRQGHTLALYCYDEPVGVPEGVELRDATKIIARSDIEAPRVARPDLYSDWFRYELLSRGIGTWLDTDVYLISRLDLESPHLFGEQGAGVLNNAVLRLPRNSPLLTQLLEPFRRRMIPRWLPWRVYLPLRIREVLTGDADLTRLPWGTTSPHALTAIVRAAGLGHLAEPPERFYPVPGQEAEWILRPDRRLEDVVHEGTVAIHLWNECIKGFKNEPAPRGSFLHRLQQEGSS